MATLFDLLREGSCCCLSHVSSPWQEYVAAPAGGLSSRLAALQASSRQEKENAEKRKEEVWVIPHSTWPLNAWAP
jgi:hypothetical protein